MPSRISVLFIILFFSGLVFAKQPKLVWCLDHVPQRQHYEPGKAPYGPMVELMQELAAKLNVDLIYTVPTPVNRCLQQLQNGEVDIVASLLYSPQRDKLFYLMPFDVAHSERWFIHKDYTLKKDKGLRVSLIKGFIYSPKLAKTYKDQGYVLHTAENIEQALTALYFRDTDVVVGPQHFTLGHIDRNIRYKGVLRLAPVDQQGEIEAHIAISRNGRYANRHDEFREALTAIRQEGKYRLYIE